MTSPDTVSDLPTGMQLTALDEIYRERPHIYLDALRDRDPVHRDDVLDRYVLTREADVAALMRDRSLSLDPANAPPGSFGALVLGSTGGDKSMLVLDDPDHKRLRGLVSKAFNLRSIEALRPRIAAVAERLVAALPEGKPFDIIGGLAAQLPLVMIAEMLGVDPADSADFYRWSHGAEQGFNPAKTPEQDAKLRANDAALSAYLRRAVEARRADRRDDLISAMVTAEEDGDRMTTAEIVTMCKLLLIAGNVTTTDLIGNAVLALLENPRELAWLRTHPDRIGDAVEEVLRYDPPVTQTVRIALAPVSVGGTTVGAGASIMPSLLAAGRDPACHADPHAFHIDRPHHTHHAFGGGAHFCLGAPLAKVEAQVALVTLLARFKVLELDNRPRTRKAAPSFNGFDELWVTGRT
ncbi:cytochrome P450 [Polymorphobacter arshaanensis]|uniref:Cytochrome P450 n=1 Tax=Glacieibacterium arshaanense TaxID=2511025 RepID=A0A4Y9EU32_9SPHN|nr:cytochrome P450 [Polymorphobacter arshaanensis]TFU06418.1 cytochrome P450 [Polymorphobacter arshaanensis]